jgi:hypothetical protein
MSQKILYFLSTENFHAHVWKNGLLSEPYYFANSADGLEKFSVFLQSHREPAYLLIDLIEEDFRQETVPHLTGASHQALVQRKFDQYYRSTAFRLSRLQKRQEDGRRDDELLFSALTNPARISAWLDLLLLQQTPIVGIYSLPHASIPLIKDIDSDHLLLLSWEKDAGLRQSYFLNKRLRFSRLTPISNNASFADVITAETARTQQYLQSLSLTPQGQLLDVHILCHASDRARLDAKLSSNHKLQYAYVDLQQLGKHLKAHDVYSDSDATPLFLHLLATQPPRASYATSSHTHYYRLWQAQRGLFGLAAASVFICLLWSALVFMQGYGIQDETEEVKSQLSAVMRETQKTSQPVPNGLHINNGSTISASDMKSAVTLLRKLQSTSATPEQILKGLAATLDKFTRIQTKNIGWQMNPGNNLPEQVITFNGELAEFGNHHRNAVDYLEKFKLALTQTGYLVEPIKMPMDFSPKGSIGANINDISEKPAEFSLKIIWRPKE